MDIQHQRIRRGNGKALMDNISTLFHFGSVEASGSILLIVLFQVSKCAQGARLESARTIAPRAGELPPMSTDAQNCIEQAQVHDYFKVGNLLKLQVLHDLPKVMVPLWDTRAQREGKQPTAC